MAVLPVVIKEGLSVDKNLIGTTPGWLVKGGGRCGRYILVGMSGNLLSANQSTK